MGHYSALVVTVAAVFVIACASPAPQIPAARTTFVPFTGDIDPTRPPPAPESASALGTPRRSVATGPCADPELELTTTTEQRGGRLTWTFVITSRCALGRLALDIRIATDRPSDARCFEAEVLRRERVLDDGWIDVTCEQIGHPPGRDLIEGWWFESSRVPPDLPMTRLTIVHRDGRAGLPEPAGLLFTWAWDGGDPTSAQFADLPLLREVRGGESEVSVRSLPVPPDTGRP